MKIAVYSGSFNPLHIGHLAILEYLVNETDFDMVYLVVSPVNPFKEGKKQTSAEERVRLAKEAVQRHSATLAGADGVLKVKVEDIELSMPAPQYTRRTLDALQTREPENDFTLVIGGDNLAAFTRWRDYDYIIERYGLAVYPREGYDIDKSLKIIQNSLNQISSSTCDESSKTPIDLSQKTTIDLSKKTPIDQSKKTTIDQTKKTPIDLSKDQSKNKSKDRIFDLKERIQIISAPEVTISSTDIREGLVNGNDMSQWLM